MSRTNISPLIRAQLERLHAGGIDISSGLRPVSSSPTVIPKKPPRSYTLSQSPSLCTTLADQKMSASCENLSDLHRETDSASTHLLTMLHSNSQQLEHSAARDRIAVKHKRQPPSRKILGVLKERDDNQMDIFSNNADDDEDFLPLRGEMKVLSQSVMDLSQLQKAQSRLRATPRSRDRSVDNILNPTFATPTYHSPSVARAISYKRPQEIQKTTDNNESLLDKDKNEGQVPQKVTEQKDQKYETVLQGINENASNRSIPSTNSTSKEHIYDNLYVFSQHKINPMPDIESNENDSSQINAVKSRLHSSQVSSRPRPVTMHVSSVNADKQMTNEFENVFNQIRHGQNRRSRYKEESSAVSTVDEPAKPRESLVIVEKPAVVSMGKTVPLIVVDTPSNNPVETSSKVPVPPLKKPTIDSGTLASTKMNKDTDQQTPLWINLAKRKQSNFATVQHEQVPQTQPEQSLPVEPTKVSKKHVVITSDEPTFIQDVPSSNNIGWTTKADISPSVLRRASTRRVPSTTAAVERDSIRALKANNPNRINNLIQLFNK